MPNPKKQVMVLYPLTTRRRSCHNQKILVAEKLHQFSESKKKFYAEGSAFFMHSLLQEQPGQYDKYRVGFVHLEKSVTNWKC
jgi:hypothetical protein